MCLAAALTLPLAGCDDGTPPPPREVPKFPAAAATTTPEAINRAVRQPEAILTAADVVGEWTVDITVARDLAFNNALEAALRIGSLASDREIEEGAMRAVPDTITGRPVYTFMNNGKFQIIQGLYKEQFNGTWKVEGDILTLTCPKFPRPQTFKLSTDHFTSIPHAPRFRGVKIIRTH